MLNSVNFASIREKIAYFRTHAFVRNTAILQVGSTLANVAQALIGILLARIFQPELYGIYALAFGLAGLLNVFLGLGAQDAVLTIVSGAHARNDRQEMRDALAFLVKMAAITGTLTLLGVVAAPFIAQSWYGDAGIGFYAGVVMLASVISTTVYSFTIVVLQVIRNIGTYTALSTADQMLRGLLALGFAFLTRTVLGVAAGHLMGASIIAIASLFVWRKTRNAHPEFPGVRTIMRRAWTVPVRKYFGFSFWIAIDRNLSNLYNILPVVLTGLYVAKSDVAFFKLAFGYLNLALNFLGPVGVLLNVEFPKMRAIGDLGRLKKNFLKVSLSGMALSALLTVSALLVAHIAFNLVYGKAFLPSVQYVYGLAFYGILVGFGIGLGSMVRTINKVTFSVRVHIANLAFWVPVGLFLINRFGLWGTVVMTTGCYATAILVNFFYLRHTLSRMEDDPVTHDQT